MWPALYVWLLDAYSGDEWWGWDEAATYAWETVRSIDAARGKVYGIPSIFD